MELFLAQNHAAMTHLPIASAIMLAVAALVGLIWVRKEIALLCSVLSVTALLTVVPTMVTGIAAAKGRFNDDGKPYIQNGIIVGSAPADARIFRHQMLGIGGTLDALALTILAVARVRGRNTNKYLIALLAVLLAVLWGIGGHLGGEDLWGPDTFPGFR
jgi:hypothetical protein